MNRGAAVDGRRRVLGALPALALAGIGGPLALAGCALAGDVDHRGPTAPDARALARPVRTAWVFSSGGPRGFVHVGVVKALAELGLVPDLLVGASVGALVAALFGAGVAATQIESLALSLQPVSLLRLSGFGSSERLSAAPVAELLGDQLERHAASPLLQALTRPVAVAACRLDDGEVVAFTHGDAAVAVQAACAIEGTFAPVRIRGRRYADADLHQPLPVRMARALGAVRVLAVDASAHEDRAPPGAGRFRDSDRHKRALTRPDAQSADVLLHPEFGYWVSLSEAFRRRAIDAGYRAAMAEKERLRALHAA